MFSLELQDFFVMETLHKACAENLQADCVQSRQAGFMQCFLMITSLQ